MAKIYKFKSHQAIIFLIIALVLVLALAMLVTSLLKTLYRLSLSPGSVAQECLKLDSLIKSERAKISNISYRISNASSGADAVAALDDENKGENRIKHIEEERVWYKCAEVESLAEKTRIFCKQVIDVISPTDKKCGPYYKQLRLEVSNEVMQKNKCIDAKIKLQHTRSVLDSASEPYQSISAKHNQIRSAEANVKSACTPPILSTPLELTEGLEQRKTDEIRQTGDLERQALDEIKRFGQWSGEGPAPQPIKAMEDLWRCNKHGDC